MVKAMPDPFIPNHSTVYWHRQRVPTDIAKVAKGRSVSVTVDGSVRPLRIGSVLKVSLGTKDPRVAKVRSRDVQDQFDLIWASFRTSEVVLTHKQTVELAGEVYRAFVLTEDDPGPAELWATVQRENADILSSRPVPNPLTIKPDTMDLKDMRFGPFVDATLAKRHLRVTPETRQKVLVETARAMQEAASLLERRAQGDYRPDETAARFPPPSAIKPIEAQKGTKSAGSDNTDSLQGLLAHKHRTQSKKEATYVSYRGYLGKFRDFIGHEIAAEVTKSDVRRWRDHLIDQGLATKTINDQYLASLKSTLAHGVKEFDLPFNAADRIRDGRTGPPPEAKGYTLDEARTILEATFRGSQKNLSVPYQRAIFWVPWICAYTGLRVSEITQFQGRNLKEKDGIPYMMITPEDGSTKGDNAWTTGIHPHLVELGLLDMFRAIGDGPAFYTPYPPGTDLRTLKDHRAKSAGDKIAEWVRDEVSIVAPGNRPSHAWRHLFTTLSRTHKMDKEARDYMLGSRSKTDAREGYGDWEPEVTDAEIGKLPRIVVAETSWRPPTTPVRAEGLKSDKVTKSPAPHRSRSRRVS
ncbi:MAG: DUF6538 domain-containing protein [Devosia sp.]